MTEFSDKWIKLFSHEIKCDYKNSAVIGGLGKIIPQWQSEALAHQVPQSEIQRITKIIQVYESSTIERRKEIISSIIGSINKANIEKDGSEKLLAKPSSNKIIIEDADQFSGLNASVTAIRKIGPQTAKHLSKLNIHSIKDLLHHYPRRYRDLSALKTINHLAFGEEVSLIGSIYGIHSRLSNNRRLKLVEAVVGDGTGYIQVTWFNQPWLEKNLPKGKQVILSGKVDRFMGRLTMTNPEIEDLDQEQLHTNRIVPIYPLTAGITQKNIRRIIFEAMKFWTPKLQDYLSPEIKAQEHLIELSQAIANIHFPHNSDLLNNSIRRLSFDEILFMQLGVLAQKNNWEKHHSEVFNISDEIIERFIKKLPFQLTNAQKKVLKEIKIDLGSGKPMNRLIQGDVGSGKTVIAALASLILLQRNAQVAFLAPTSLLAEQHYRTLIKMFANCTEKVIGFHESDIGLLLGETPEKEKEEIRNKLASGQIKIIVGTHALLESPIIFRWLQLVIIDEQHRFGVMQRALLRSKGDNPHLLVMTATPIPRSLALTIYGDLDISVIDEMPLGRLPVETHVLLPAQRMQAYQLIESEINLGHQVFIIYPLIENENDELFKSAVDEFHRIQKEVFPQFKMGLMHGRLKQIEKDAIMKQFRDNHLNILISTTVIEVGMDIPNATVVLIEGADRFGLAQLHQIRGRVGRGEMQSYCLLIPENESNSDSQRLSAMAETNDGFKLAEYDLKQRGPGDFLGTRQSGYNGLKLASLSDSELISEARRVAISIFKSDPTLNDPANKLLCKELQSYWPNLSGDIS